MIETLIERVPYVGAVVLITVLFLRHIKSERKGREKMEEMRLNEYERMSKRCHNHTAELNERACTAIDASAETLKKNIEMLGAISETMKACADRANGRTPR
jgi:hypothetical protein